MNNKKLGKFLTAKFNVQNGLHIRGLHYPGLDKYNVQSKYFLVLFLLSDQLLLTFSFLNLCPKKFT